MKKALMRIACICLSALLIVCSFSACSKTVEINEKNVTEAVEIVEKALQEFDYKTLEKYVESETLSYILTLAKSHEQFVTLGQKMFGNLEMSIEKIDVSNKTVDIKVTNKNLYSIASNFTYKLKNEHSTFQLVELLDNDAFLDISLGELSEEIDEATLNIDPTVITLTVKQGKRNLILCFDESAEDAVSGGALTAIQSAIGVNSITKKK